MARFRFTTSTTLAPESIAAVRLRVAPLVMDLCNQTNITKGLQGKFSVYHGAAIGLVRGKAGIREYTDEAVNEPRHQTCSRTARPRWAILRSPKIRRVIEVELTNGGKIYAVRGEIAR